MDRSCVVEVALGASVRARELASGFSARDARPSPYQLLMGLRCPICHRSLVAVVKSGNGAVDAMRALAGVTRCPHGTRQPQPVLIASSPAPRSPARRAL